MTVIRPNSVSGINSITVQSGNSLAVHKANGELIRTLTSSSGVSTFSTLSVGTATTDNSAAKSINIGLGASISQHNDNALTFGTNGDPRITIDASGNLNVGSAATIKSGGNATFSGIVTAASFIGDGSGLTGAGPTLTGSTNNTIVTVTGANAIQGESNLTFDGSALAYSAAGAERFNLAHTSGGTVALKNTSNASMQFGTNNTTRMTITSSGGVGIGTESPDFEFTVADASGAAVIRAKDNANGKVVDMIANSTGGLVRTIGSYPLVLNTNQTERLRIGPSGGVGISTDKIRNADFLHIATLSQDFTNPTEELMDGGGICFQTIDNLAATGRSFPGIFWAPNTNELGRARAGIIGVAASNNDATDIVFLGKYLPGGEGIYPRNERMRIRAQTGYVGINTSLPGRHLHIVGGDGPTQATIGNSDTQLVLDNKGTNGAIMEFLSESDSNGYIMFTDTDASNRGIIRYNHASDFMAFTAAGTERIRINSDGLYQANSTNDTAYTLSIAGAVRFQFVHSGGGNMVISNPSSGNVTYSTSSDYRLKENATTINNALTTVKALKPYQFTWKHDSQIGQGFFAHEVLETVPNSQAAIGTKDAVHTEDDDIQGIKKDDPIYQGVDYSKLVPLLTAALQEATTKIETLETKVAALEGG